MTRYYYMPGCMNDGTVTHVIAATRVGIRTHTSGTYADLRHELVWYGPTNARRYAVRAWVVGSVAYMQRAWPDWRTVPAGKAIEHIKRKKGPLP